jgi:methionyl-tRNA formyltransferase
MKVIFFGTSGEGLPTLNKLAEAHEVVGVVTAPDAVVGRQKTIKPSAVAQWAAQTHVPILKPAHTKSNPELLQSLTELKADIFIVVSYGKILPEEIINLPRLKTLNIHFSALPKYRGASPIQFALLNGDKTTATTIFILEPELDTGPIIAQEVTTIEDDDTMATLSPRMSEQSAELLLKTLPDYKAGKIIPQAQNHAQASYTKIFSKKDGLINWSRPANQIYNQWRAFTPWPGIWTKWQGKNLKILQCTPTSVSQQAEPGIVLHGGAVVCGEQTILQINKLQLEGKAPTDIKSFLNGYPKFVGSNLNEVKL